MSRFKPSALFQTLSILLVLAAGLIWSERALAAPPKVAASIKPVQALVKMVMGSLGTPDVIIPATASPHVFSLKPSQAKMLEHADVVFWIGPNLENTLNGPLAKLSKNATVVALMSAEGIDFINTNERHIEDYDDHQDDKEDAHDHGSMDPHIWLSPNNAIAMLAHIEHVLSQVDPANAQEYAANAKKSQRRVSILINQTKKFTTNMQTIPYLVQHNAFGYLAREFGFKEAGYLQTVPGREPGAKHIAGLIKLIEGENLKCLFHEPQFTPKLAKRLSQEHGVSLREIDPLGADLSLSDTTYVRIIQGIIVSMQSCLTPQAKQPAQ
ncbi:zinc ABC transporter substrate-binding protein [Magnetovibrio sp. PR-2]|uniref:zinc ABC transporter substrate-binding protein n=1 Tax=Magnetovibrio sp. PR-2 TaxID=3120356 RepID=UPI002FCE0B9F